MPALQKFHANVARHVKLMNKNLAANLIRHEYIVTGRTKAKRAQTHIESFLAKALHEDKQHSGKPLHERIASNKALNYLQPPDKKEVGTKVLETLSQRYPGRNTGFTRIIKLEPRLGEDKAPMSVLELVDSEFEIRFWYTAKIVARLELQGLQVDDLTAHTVEKLTKHRPNGKEAFREAVETAKARFFAYDAESGEVTTEEARENLKNQPRNLEYHGGALLGKVLISKKFNTTERPQRQQKELPKSPFLA